MVDDVSDIKAMYDRDPDNEDQRLERHQLEYELTWRYLDKYLPPEGSILEIGAATGRYTIELAKRGYKVTAVDMSEKLLEICQRRLTNAGLEERASFILADARDLSPVEGRHYDALLLMGPLYHLVVEADRQTALRESYQHLKDGGVIFSAFISRFGIWGDVMKNIPEWIERQDEVRSILERGRDPEEKKDFNFRGYFATVPEINPLHEEIGFETLALAGVEPAISADDESYNRLEGEQRQLWLDLFYELSIEESIMGASRHLLYVGRKREK
jgi:SAM-dependent methyltransferase